MNVLTKCDLLDKKKKKKLDEYCDPDPDELVYMLNKDTPKRFKQLNKAIGSVVCGKMLLMVFSS